MNQQRAIFIHGTQTDLAGAEQVVAAVRTGGVDAALVSTWEQVETDVVAADDLAATRRGWLAREDAEVRWRREGDRVLVTVVSETPIDGLAMERHLAEEVLTGPRVRPRWEPADGQRSPRRLTYLDAHGRVLAARDEPAQANGEA